MLTTSESILENLFAAYHAESEGIIAGHFAIFPIVFIVTS